jgi:hypothetical protein
LIPQGSSGNSPAIYRWVKAEQRSKVPLGTTEKIISRLYETGYLTRCAPSAEALGYFQIGPYGTKSEKTAWQAKLQIDPLPISHAQKGALLCFLNY